ncbi:MAG TPA: hypothetical protein VD860_01870 [Azospirillum sp.]|nr:hypothetical protein [Azospirillum sp.]
MDELAKLHEERHAAAVATIVRSPAPPVTPMEFITADGRRGWPLVVEYRVFRGDRCAQEYAPTMEPVPPAEAEIPYEAVVHDLAAYDRLKATGALDVGHRLPPADRQATPAP